MARQSSYPFRPNPEKNPRRDPTAAGERDAAVNRIASHNYFLLEKFETGVVLGETWEHTRRSRQSDPRNTERRGEKKLDQLDHEPDSELHGNIGGATPPG